MGRKGDWLKKSLFYARFFIVKLLKKYKIYDIINEYRFWR